MKLNIITGMFFLLLSVMAFAALAFFTLLIGMLTALV